MLLLGRPCSPSRPGPPDGCRAKHTCPLLGTDDDPLPDERDEYDDPFEQALYDYQQAFEEAGDAALASIAQAAPTRVEPLTRPAAWVLR